MWARIHFLVKDLLNELESEQIKLSTDAYLRLQELLLLLPDDISDTDLLLALVPVLARSGREQELTYEKFASCQRRADEVFGPRPTANDSNERRPINPVEQKIKNSKCWFLVAILFTALLAGLFWRFYPSEKTAIIQKSFTVKAGQVLPICPFDLPELDRLGSENTRFDLKFIQEVAPDTSRTMPSGSVWIGSSALADYYVQNDTCLLVAARDSVKTMDSLVLNVIFSNQKKGELLLRIFIVPKIETPQKEQPATKISWATWFHKNWYWLRWAIFGPLCALLLALWRWLEWGRNKLYAQLDRKDKPPYVWTVEIPGAEEVVLGDAYHHALQVMRRRTQSDVQHLDMERTIASTVEQGGLPKFQYRPVSEPVDYLMLLDRQHTGNHYTQLFNAFYRAFKTQELAIERYFYDSDLRLCFNEVQPDGVRLTELAQRFAGARLVLVGSGLQLIHPLRSGLVAWADLFEHWPQRLLLTPRHPVEWTRNERLLSALFQVLPATLQSLSFWVEELEMGEDARFDRLQEHVQDVPAAIFQPDEVYPLASLLLQFPHEVVRWVAACAIYPSLHWDLTLWFGQQLETHSGLPLLGHDPLLRLFRIRWFVEGQVPEAARGQLLEWLYSEDPSLVLALRRDLADVLEQSPPPEDSMAWVDHRLQIVFNRWMSESDRKARKKLKKELIQLLSQADKDFITLKYLDVPLKQLHFEVPPTLKRYVDREYRQEFFIFNRTKKPGSIQEKEFVEEKEQQASEFENQKRTDVFAEMVFVQGGTFQMGNNGGVRFGHSVTLNDFYLGKYPVTQKQWYDIMGNNPAYFKNCADCPVEQVSWDEVQEFLKKLNAKFPGKNYRLPSEAEWEYAARGGRQSKSYYQYAGSNTPDEVAWYDDNSSSKTHIVGGKKANELGIYDMSGNVWEWCQDVWHDNYQSAPTNGSAWVSGSDQSRRVLRGGSWNDFSSSCRLVNRSRNYSISWNNSIGFRLVQHP